MKKLEFCGVSLNVDWTLATAIPLAELPRVPGIYVEIHWPQRGARVGETGVSIRGKCQRDASWFDQQKAGTARDQHRTLPIALAAKAHGREGFHYYVVSTDPRLDDEDFRKDCELFMIAYVRANPDKYVCWNRQKGRGPSVRKMRATLAAQRERDRDGAQP